MSLFLAAASGTSSRTVSWLAMALKNSELQPLLRLNTLAQAKKTQQKFGLKITRKCVKNFKNLFTSPSLQS
mgnify:CR=1 FL=1